jgi:hypothetical protein
MDLFGFVFVKVIEGWLPVVQCKSERLINRVSNDQMTFLLTGLKSPSCPVLYWPRFSHTWVWEIFTSRTCTYTYKYVHYVRTLRLSPLVHTIAAKSPGAHYHGQVPWNGKVPGPDCFISYKAITV